ncbi:Usherin, partial [Varanus komodoensis]
FALQSNNWIRVASSNPPSLFNLDEREFCTFLLQGQTHHTHLFGLKPFTTYHIYIVAVNRAGQVSSPWTSVRTLEAPPSGLSNFTVERKEDGRSLLLKWAEPSKPNGNIKTYNIFNDDNLEYSGLSRQFLFRRLEPFTLYTLVLEACTAAGCSRSSPQPIWTDEAPPVSQMAPVIQSVNATSIGLSWSKPINSNGKIIRYEVIHRCTKENASGNNATTEEEKIVLSEYNTENNTFEYNAHHLQPWTSHEYKIRAWNSAGYADSSWTVAKTSQAAPRGLAPPLLRHIPASPSQVLILWSSPEEPNGVLQSYRLQRNYVAYPFSFDATTFNYTDEELLPYSEYHYAVTACTMGGCSTSNHTSIRTLEAAPAMVDPPMLNLSSTQMNVSWSTPQIQNGEITKYILKLNGEEVYIGKGFFRTVLNLQPYSEYDVTLLACTSGGCTASASQSIKTMEAPPLNLDAPRLLVTGSESIEITWKAPANPNGKIQMYELRRNGLLVYSGMDTHYHDFMLTPGIEYSYAVTANNSQGSITSPLAKIRTNPSAPSGMSPPRLQAWSSETILVNWDTPAKVSGDIINYTITLRDPIISEKETVHLNSSHVSFGRQSYTLAGLKPYHRYEVQVQVCTLLGCTSSEWASVQTPEALPETQPAPLVDVQSSRVGFRSAVSIVWTGPKQPNGKILYYELYRRQATPSQLNQDPVLVYNGSSTSFKDVLLLPFTEYEYQVWSVNSAGRTASSWTPCKTGPAPPQGLPAPRFGTVASTSAVVSISPPLKPNGIVSLYRLFSNSTKGKDVVQLSEGTATQQTIHGLKPFTTYSVGVEACTCFNCCSKGPMAQVTTQPAPPAEQPPPHVHSMSSRVASFQWDAPQEPNGIVGRYELHMYASCPAHVQPIERTCKAGPVEVRYAGNGQHSNVSDLQPYTTYKLRVVSYNSAGSTASEWISFTTQKEGKCAGEHSVQEFLEDECQRKQEQIDHTTFFKITYLFSLSIPSLDFTGPTLTTPGENHGVKTKQAVFYTELWFVVLMAILGLLLLAIFLSLILRKKISKQPYARERPPLVPLQKRMSPMSVYSQGETHMKPSLADNPRHQPLVASPLQVPVISSSQVSQSSDKFERVADTSESSSSVTLKSYTMHLEGLADTKIPGPASPRSLHSSQSTSGLQVPSQSQMLHTFSQGSLRRSVSQLIDVYDKKSLTDDMVWDTILHGHDSGLSVQILLDLEYLILSCGHCSSFSIVCKFDQQTVHPFFHVIYEKIKQNRSQDRALGDRACHWLPSQ